MLTGPGGLFEVVTEDVRGIAMPVYKNRMPSLRVLAELGLARGNETLHLVHGERRIGFAESVEISNSVACGLADIGVGAGDRVAILSANNPEWVLTVWGTVDLGAVVVGLNGWWKSDEIVYGLADSGAKVLVADRDRFVRVAGRLGELPDLEAVYLIDADPAEGAGWGGGRPFDGRGRKAWPKCGAFGAALLVRSTPHRALPDARRSPSGRKP